MRKRAELGLLAAIGVVAALAGAWWLLRDDANPVQALPSARSASDVARAPEPVLGPVHPEQESRSVALTSTEDEARAAAADGERYHGRVVNAARFPVAGAAVSIFFPEIGRTAGTTDAKGSFELRVRRAAKTLTGSVYATDGERVAVRPCRLHGTEAEPEPASSFVMVRAPDAHLDLGTLVLEDGQALSVRVQRAGAPVPDSEVSAGYTSLQVPLATARADDAGIARLPLLPLGQVFVSARSARELGRSSPFLPVPAGEVVIQIEEPRSLDIWVSNAATNEPIAGAEVKIEEQVPFVEADWRPRPANAITFVRVGARVAPTDAAGHTRIEELPREGRFYASASASAFTRAVPPRSDKQAIPPDASEVRLQLTPFEGRTVRLRVIPGEVDVPASGSRIALSRGPGAGFLLDDSNLPSAGTMEASDLVISGVNGYITAIAEAPDGALAQVHADASGDFRGGDVSFRKPRKIEVLVRDRSGQPVEGAQAVARNQGNNALCDYRPTDAEGRVVLERLLAAGLTDVYVVAPGMAGLGDNCGTVDLEQGDGRVEAVLPAMHELLIHMRLDGIPRLPAQYQVGSGMVLEEYPESGALRLALPIAKEGVEQRMTVQARSYLSQTVTFVPDFALVPQPVVVELETAGMLVAHVERPVDGKIEILLEERAEDGEDWQPAKGQHGGMRNPNGANETFVFANLKQGVYRIRDEQSGLASDVGHLLPGVASVDVYLDLGSVQWVRGRVAMPEDTYTPRVRVLVDGGEPVALPWMAGREPLEGIGIDSAGVFAVRVPGNRPVTLRAWHPWLTTPPDGAVTVTEGRDDVVLRLVPGNEVQIPLHSVLDGLYQKTGVRIWVYEQEPAGAPLAWFHAPVIDGVARFGGIAPGAHTLWIDLGRGYAPCTLRDVAIAEGTTELAEPKFAAGSSIRVRVLVDPGEAVPRIYVSAVRQGEPSYFRDVNSSGEEEVVLAGFGAGTFEVRANGIMGARTGLIRTLEVDGVNDVTLELEMR